MSQDSFRNLTNVIKIVYKQKETTLPQSLQL